MYLLLTHPLTDVFYVPPQDDGVKKNHRANSILHKPNWLQTRELSRSFIHSPFQFNKEITNNRILQSELTLKIQLNPLTSQIKKARAKKLMQLTRQNSQFITRVF